MSMSKENQNDAAPGDYPCWAAFPTVQIVRVGSGEMKVILSVCADLGGDVETVEIWMTLDTKITTSKGKKRIDYTREAFDALGALDALPQIGAAIKANPDVRTVEIRGLFVDNKPAAMASLNVWVSNGYTNYNVQQPRTAPSVPGGLADDLLAMGPKGSAIAAPVEMFKKPAPRPAAAPKPASEPMTQEQAKALDDEPSFP